MARLWTDDPAQPRRHPPAGPRVAIAVRLGYPKDVKDHTPCGRPREVDVALSHGMPDGREP